MENYFDNMEDIDAQYLEDFNNKMGWFNKLERQPRFNMIDFKAIDRNGRKINIELKTRNISINSFDNIFIEPLKYNNMITLWRYYIEKPLFINFFDDGNDLYVVVWSLVDMEKPEITTVEIFNPGKNKKETVERYLLPLKKGACYRKNNDTYERIF